MRVLLALLLSVPAWGQISATFAGTDKASNATGGAVTSLSTAGTSHTAGRALVALIRLGTVGATVSSVTNTAGDTWSACSPIKTGTQGAVQWWYALNSAGNASDVVTANFTTSVYTSVIVGEIAGIATSSAVDVCSGSTGNSGTGTAATASSFSTSQADEIILHGVIWGALSITTTANSGYTAVADTDGMGGLQYRVVSSTQSGITPTLTLSSSQDWIGQVLTLKAPGGGSPTTTVRRGQIF
jgi:hypothetical protein